MLPASVDERAEVRWNSLREQDVPYCGLLPPFEHAGSFILLEEETAARMLPFDALYDRRLSDLVLTALKPLQND
jgi:hypothetical protein